MNSFENTKKNFGFGCMRLPMIDKEVDIEQFTKMVDVFMENGFNYFDTAHVYIGGKSELALKECLTSRYNRDEYVLTDKLSGSNFNSEEELETLLNEKLEACGVKYFDFYLMHAQNRNNFEKFKKCKAYEFALKKKEEGKIKHLGISFHDTADILEKILIEYPEIEVVQIQFNYLDYLDPEVQGKLCYEVCRKYNKPIIVMEPVKGGKLANLPEDAKKVLNDLNNGSPASYAIRYVCSFPGVYMTLSGMSNMEQMLDNLSYMKEFTPLNEDEFKAIDKVIEVINSYDTISCTNCRYCVDGCPKQIKIPDLFSCYNSKIVFDDSWSKYYYTSVLTKKYTSPSECIKCGKCEKICPQHLNIIELLKVVDKEFQD